jgi:hypothetical protein
MDHAGARYEHHCTTSSSTSTRHTCGRGQSNHRANRQLREFRQFSASREQSSCRFGILVRVKPQRFVNDASGDHVIIDERKPKFSRQKSLTANGQFGSYANVTRIVVRRPSRTFVVIIFATEEHNGWKFRLTGSCVEPWIENGAGFYRCNYFGSDERPRRYLRRGSYADGSDGHSRRDDLSRTTNRSCGT